MKNNNGRQEYGINLNNAELRANVAESKRLLHGVGDSAIAEGARIDNSYKKLASTIATIGASVGVGMLAKQLYGFANAFDKSMKEVSTISGTVANDMAGFKNSILEMTTEIPVGADEAAKALYQIVSAGHDGAAGMQVLEVAAKAAIGGVTQTVTAADAITTVLNAYKKDASEAEGISDQLFTTVRLGKTTFGELGQSIAQVAPMAASFGVETEQVLAAVATLTKSGTPTAQAMTQIRAAIKGASKELGDGYFQLHTFQEGLAEIANRAGGSEAELLRLMPEVEGMVAVLGLTGINAKTAASDLMALGDSAGATGQAFAKMNDQADAQLTILKNTILKKFHDIGEGAVDMVGGFAKLLNSDGVFNDKAIDDVIATLVVLIATVGMYKTSMLAANAIQRVSTNVQYAAEIAELQKLLPAKQASADADIHQAFAKGRITEATAERLIAIRAEVAAELEGLKVKALAAQKELEAAIQADKNALRRSVIAKQNLALSQSQMQIALQGGSAEEIADAKTSVRTAKIEVNSAARARNTTQQAIGTAQTQVAATATAVDTMQINVNTAATRSASTAKNLFSAATARLTKAFHSLKVAFATNPIGMILTGVTMAISLFSMFGNKVDEASKGFGEFALKIKQEQDTFKDLKKAVESTKEGTKERADLIKLINQRYPEYLSSMLTEKSRTDDIISALTTANEKMIENIKLKLKQSQLEGILSKQLNTETDFTDKLVGDYSKTNKTPAQVAIFVQEVATMVEKAREGKASIEDARSILISLGENADRVNNTIISTDTGIARRLRRMVGQFIDIKKAADEAGNSKQILDELLKTAEIEEPKPNPKPTPDPDKKAAKDYSDEKIAEMLELERMKIDLLEEGRAKELAQIEQTKDEKLAAIQKEQNEIAAEIAKGGLTKAQKTAKTERSGALEAQKGLVNQLATQDSAKVNEKYNKEIAEQWKSLTSVFLTEEQKRSDSIKDKYDKEREQADKLFSTFSWQGLVLKLTIDAAEAKEQLDALTADYQTYGDKRKKIEEKFSADIKALEAKNTDGKLDGNIKEAKKQRDEALKGLKFDEAKEGVDLSKLFGNLDNMTLPSMKELRDKIKVWIDGAGKDLSPEDLKAVTEAFNNLDLKIADKDPFAVMKTAAKDYKTSIKAAKEAQEAYNKSLKENGKDSEVTKKAEEELKTAQAARAAATAKSTESMQSVAQKGSEIVGLAKDVMGILGDLGVEVPEQISGAIDGLGQVFDGVAGMNLAEPFSIVTGSIKILIGAIKTVSALFNGDADRNRDIENWQKSIDGLEKQYDTLAKSIEKAYSQSAAGLIEQQNKLLEDQKRLIEQQKEAERSKKDPDDGALDSYDDKLNEINEKIADNNEKAIDAIFGADLKSAIDNFASAYLDAWSAGEDRAEAQKDVVKKMIQGIIQEMLKSDIKGQVEAMRKKIQELLENDGVLDDSELAEIDLMGDEIGKIMEDRAKIYDKILKDEDAQNDKSMAGQIRGSVATEASVSELGGLFRSQTDSLLRIDSKMDLGFGHLLEIARSNAAVEHNTAMIAANTAQTVAMLAGGFSSMQSELQAINKNTSKDGGSYGN